MAPDDIVAEVRDGRYRPFYWIDRVINTEYAPRIHASGLAVYGVLAMHAGVAGECWVSLETITREAGLSDRNATAAALGRLANEHLIVIERQSGRQNTYRLLDVYQGGDATRPRRPSEQKPAGKSSRSADDPRGNPAAPAGKSSRLGPNLLENPARTREYIDNRSSSRVEIDDDDARARESSSSSASSALSSASSSSPSAAASTPETWDDLTTLYGLEAVQHARRVAANPAKKNDFAYIRGVLKRLARRGRAPTGSGVFGDQRLETGEQRPETGEQRPEGGDQRPADVDGVDTEAAAVDPVWGAAVEGLRQTVTRGTFDAYVRDARLVGMNGDALVVEVRTAGARDWMKARLAGRVREAWVTAGGAPVSLVQFVTEGER